MNLEYAAYLLSENTILNEDADGSGQNGAKAWFRDNLPNIEFGNTSESETENPESLKMKAMAVFGHQLNQGRAQRIKGTYKFLPGAVRIAVTDCGWLTEHENTKMMKNLISMYAAAFFEWQDGIAAGLHGASPRDPYPGKYNKDLNGLTYTGLYRELGSKIPEAEERLAAQRAGATAQVTPEEEAARAAREAEEREQERIRNSTAGEYHIEFIPNYRESHKWYKYTNPQSTEPGCHWCITQSSGYWSDYYSSDRSIYFCWKAPSKEALLEMNNHLKDYFDEEHDDIMKAPFNEYGLSLICIIVENNGNGKPSFVHATSRYNHYGPLGRWIGSAPYGDDLLPRGRAGFPKLLEILGITAEEFERKFPIRSDSGDDSHDHTELINLLSEIRNNSSATADMIRNKIQGICQDVNYTDLKDHGIMFIRHAGEYNFIDSNYNLLSQTRWFFDVNGAFHSRECVPVGFKDEHGRSVWNLLKTNGEFMLAKNVNSIILMDDTCKYALFKIATCDGNSMYNIVNMNNGNILLRKPVYMVKLAKSYFGSIPVIEKEGDPWSLVDLKGKKKQMPSSITPVDVSLYDSTYNDNGKYLMAVQLESGNTKFGIVNLQKNKLVYSTKNIHTVIYDIKEKYFITYDRQTEKYSLYDGDGNVIIANNPYRFKFDQDATVVWFDSPDRDTPVKFYSLKENRFMDPVPDLTESGLVDIYKNAILVNRNVLYVDGEKVFDNLNQRNIYALPKPFSDFIYCPAKYMIYDIKNKRIIDNDVRSLVTEGDNYSYLCVKTRNSVKTYNSAGEVIAEIPNVYETFRMNYGCVLVKFSDSQNIINSDGELMFKMNFKAMRTSFNDEGVAQIICGQNTYYINTEGDVSRAIELITENTRIKYGEPVLMEYSSPRRTWIDHAARFLD